MQRQRGFNIIELMIVVAIIGVLSMLAYPSFSDYLMRSKITEATSNLADLRVKMEQYYQDTRSYGTGGNCGNILPPAGAKYFQFTCLSANASPAGLDQSYTWTATGNTVLPADIAMQGFIYTIDQANTKQTSIAAPANAARWNPGSITFNCWVLKPNNC